MNLNLVEDPWILVRTLRGEEKMVSLREILLHAQDYSELAGETAPQNFAVLRLLLAINLTILYRFNPEGDEDLLRNADQALDRWRTVWESEALLEKPVNEYLDRYKDRFWLGGEGRRFLQTEVAKKGTEYKASKLIGDLSESNNKIRLFPLRNGEEKETVTQQAAVRWLLNLNGFDDTSVKPSTEYSKLPEEQKLSPGAGWLGKLGVVYVKGSSLFETIMLNTVLLKNGKELWKQVRPYWEIDQPDVSERRLLSQVPDDLAAVLTLPSRRIWLIFTEEGRVNGYYLLGGDFFPKENAFSEQFTLWRNVDPKKTEQNTFVPRRHQSGRQFWRDFQYLVINLEQQKQGEKEPGVIGWIRTLTARDCLDIDQPIEVSAPTVAYNAKGSSVTDTSSQAVRLYPKILTEEGEEEREWIQKEIDHLDSLAYAVGMFAKTVGLASGADTETSSKQFEQAQERFYAAADQPFLEWMLDIDPNGLETAQQVQDIRSMWHRTAVSIARRITKSYLSSVRPESLIGKKTIDKKKEIHVSIPEAINSFNYRVYHLYGNLNKENENEQ